MGKFDSVRQSLVWLILVWFGLVEFIGLLMIVWMNLVWETTTKNRMTCRVNAQLTIFIKGGLAKDDEFWTCEDEVRRVMLSLEICPVHVFLGNYIISSVKHLATGHNPPVWTVRASNIDFSQFGSAAPTLLIPLMDPFLSACRHCTRKWGAPRTMRIKRKKLHEKIWENQKRFRE